MRAVSDRSQVTCDTCGTHTRLDTNLCGRCATDWQTPEGRERINSRRATNGLPPLANYTGTEGSR
jgi:hypothetical protein